MLLAVAVAFPWGILGVLVVLTLGIVAWTRHVSPHGAFARRIEDAADRVVASFAREEAEVFRDLSPERAQHIRDMSAGDWTLRIPADKKGDDAWFESECARWDREIESFLREVTNPRELHAFVYLWNWGDGAAKMAEIAMHPHCDQGTALMLFWLTDPQDWLEADQGQTDAETQAVIETVLARTAANDFATSDIHFEPYKTWDGVKDKPEDQRYPRVMYEPVVGKR